MAWFAESLVESGEVPAAQARHEQFIKVPNAGVLDGVAIDPGPHH